jgi:hypothetical protein
MENATDDPWVNVSSIISGDAFSGTRYSSTDSVNRYGFGYTSAFPENCQEKNLIIQYTAQLRSAGKSSEAGIVTSVTYGDSAVYWSFENFNGKLKDLNKWTAVSGQLRVPRKFTGPEYKLSVYLWNKDGVTRFDMDDLVLSFSELQMPSFLPPANNLFSRPEKFDQKYSIRNAAVWLNKKDGGAFIENLTGDTVISSLSLISETRKGSSVKHQWQNKWTARKDTDLLSEGKLQLMSANDFSNSSLVIDASAADAIHFRLTTVFSKPVTLNRIALVLRYPGVLESVYKNSITHPGDFYNEYWLGREGLSATYGDKKLVLYHPKKISSIQLNTETKEIYVNSDFYADHPMLHFPLMEKSIGRFTDVSASVYKKGDSLVADFEIDICPEITKIPLLMNSPKGFQSVFIWTEHADYTNLRTQRAVYFGSDRITRPDSAVGGFIRYSIPVTKSVFYSNPEPVDNSVKAAFLKGPEVTVKEFPEFRNFLKSLEESGMEICLHTPDHYTCDRKSLDEALSNMRRDFSTVTWIDHGYDNSIYSNREDLNCDGSIPESKYYSADLWKKYGIEYIWNSYFEDTNLFAPYAYYSFLTVPYSGWNESMPVPDYWKHPSRTGDLIHWRTSNTLDIADTMLWSYFFNDFRLNDLVNSRGTYIVHSYPARADSTTGFYDYSDSEITANRSFNEMLARLSDYRKAGKIRLCTIKDMLAYRTSLDNISYEFTGNGIVRLHNDGRAPIYGLSFSVPASEVKSSKKEMKQKRSGDDVIFWMDIEAGETIDLLIK